MSRPSKRSAHSFPQLIVYQIYPKSFKDSNNDGVGDLAGIIEKLDYLDGKTNVGLGVDVIWLSPIFKSPMVDGGYDIADYVDIDPSFGTFENFNKLLEEAHKRGIKTILDFVPNHTSDQHPWFLKSKSSRDNPKRNYYIWKNPKKDGSAPNNWLSAFGGSAWEYDKPTGQYYLHSFYKEQPDLNWRNPLVFKEMVAILKFWLDKGVDGFRIDSVHMIFKDQVFRDDPPNPDYQEGVDDPYNALVHINSMKQPERFEVLKAFSKFLDSYKDKIMITEEYTDILGMTEYYNIYSSPYHIPLNFNLLLLPWNAEVFKKFLDTYEQSLKPHNTPNFVLSNHDRARVASRLGPDAAKVAAMLLLTLRGIIFIYYGEELELENVEVPKEKITDRNTEKQKSLEGGRDPVRTPMQWNSDKYAGFSKVEPWLPVAKNFQEVNVQTQSKNPHSTFSLYRKLIRLRRSNQALKNGAYVPLPAPDKNVLAFIRQDEKNEVLVLLNFSDQKKNVSLNYRKAKNICNTFLDVGEGEVVNLTKFTLRANEGCIFDV